MKRLVLLLTLCLFPVMARAQTTSQRVVYTILNPPTVCARGKLYTNSVAQKVWLGTSTSTCLQIDAAAAAGLASNNSFTGVNTFTPTARTSGSAAYFTINIPADTGQTAATESIGYKHVTGTRTWATTGTVALQRENYFAGPTYASASASQTFTDVFNAYFDNPILGTNAIFTRPHTVGIVDATSASSSVTGGLVVATTLGTTATSVGIGGGNINAGGKGTFNTGVDFNAAIFTLGNKVLSRGAPSIAGNGTLNANSKDMAGKVTSTVTGAATITVTFSGSGGAFSNAPACSGSNETTSNLMRFTSTTSAVVITGTTVTGDVISYICIGY